jgi:hypothetical protein
MAFDPDKFLAETAQVKPQSGFDPDKFLAETAAKNDVDPTSEAELGFVNRARFSIEPIQSNRAALLSQEYGPENVLTDKDGNLFLKQDGVFKPVNMEGFSAADVSDFAGSLPEAAGSTVGFAAGAIGGGGVASVPAAIGLGAAGGAVGSAFRQGLSAALGTPQVATKKERAMEVGVSAAFGGGASAVGAGVKAVSPLVKSATKRLGKATVDALPGGRTAVDAIEASYQATKNTLKGLDNIFNPRKAADYPEVIKVINKYPVIQKELLPEAVEFGKESVVSRGARAVAEGPFGESKLKAFYKSQGQVTSAIDQATESLAQGKRLSGAPEAGNYLIDRIEAAKEGFFSNIDVTYSKIAQQSPGVGLTSKSLDSIGLKLKTLEKFAKGEAEKGIGSQVSEGRSLLQAIKNLRKTDGSLAETVDGLQRIGREAYKKSSPGRIPVDSIKLRQLYHGVQEDVVDSVRQTHGNDVANALLENNKMITDFLGESSVLSKVLDAKDAAPENVFKSLVQNGDSRKIEALKAIIPPSELPQLKAAALDSFIVRNNDGLVMYESTAKMFKKKADIISALFEPEEIADVRDLIRLGRRMGDPVLSSSGTGASNAFGRVIDLVKNSVSNETNLEILKRRARAFNPKSSKLPGMLSKAAKVRINPAKTTVGGLSGLSDETQRDITRKSRGFELILKDKGRK